MRSITVACRRRNHRGKRMGSVECDELFTLDYLFHRCRLYCVYRGIHRLLCNSKRKQLLSRICTFAHLLVISGVTRVGVTRAGNWGCHPYFFLKNWQPFLLITVTFIDFTRVLPLSGCHPHHFLPARPHLSTVTWNSTTFFSFGCHPLEGVTRGGPSP